MGGNMPNTHLGRLIPRARRILFTVAVLAISNPPFAAYGQSEAYAAGKPVCLDVNRIDHTQVLSDHQILFYMYGKKIWVNNLTNRCATLTSQDGFVWESSIPKYCDNLETIRVIRSGEVCLLGAFTPDEKKAS